jgi:hypothetical protein
MNRTRAKKIYLTGTQMFKQAVWFFLHSLFSLMAWVTMMAGVTLTRPESVPAGVTLTLSFGFPLIAGFSLVKIRKSDVATLTWLTGLVWFMIVGLWILDMPTGAGACYHCGPGDKLWYSLFSLHADNGLLDGQGRFVGTWPAVAMIGYSLGAKLAMLGRETPFQEPQHTPV